MTVNAPSQLYKVPPHVTSDDIPAPTRQSSAVHLQARLADSLDLVLQTKQAYWNVRGENFMSLHLMFDQFNKDIEKVSDQLAERLVTIGGQARGTREFLDEHSSLDPYPGDAIDPREHLVALQRAYSKYSESLRTDIHMMTGQGDFVSEHVLVETLGVVERTLWILDAELSSNT